MKEIFKNKYGSWAIITGASGNLGSAFARNLAMDKFNLIIQGRNKEKLELLQSGLIKTYGIDVKTYIGNLDNTSQLNSFSTEIRKVDFGLLILNAGIFPKGHFDQISPQDHKISIGLNVISITSLLQILIPKLKKRVKSGVIVVSSVQANKI